MALTPIIPGIITIKIDKRIHMSEYVAELTVTGSGLRLKSVRYTLREAVNATIDRLEANFLNDAIEASYV